ncbi:hypothetical protein NPIL_95951 [Nephila pilipes]|uniref:Uncharacterized protein n=1 Tax=Nephila pilipes TaxID=299642 RepID=A0A8X6TUA1_NEPPI|nr:hypothetical protein NPIL_95951 [Nephila pilipes]
MEECNNGINPESSQLNSTPSFIDCSEFPSLDEPVSIPRQLKNDVKHSVLTRGSTVFSKPRQLTPDKLKAAK